MHAGAAQAMMDVQGMLCFFMHSTHRFPFLGIRKLHRNGKIDMEKEDKGENRSCAHMTCRLELPYPLVPFLHLFITPSFPFLSSQS